MMRRSQTLRQRSQHARQELFHETLKDIYYAEKKILSALPMARAAQSEDLKAAFEKHEGEIDCVHAPRFFLGYCAAILVNGPAEAI
jgi:hypothetical protein